MGRLRIKNGCFFSMHYVPLFCFFLFAWMIQLTVEHILCYQEIIPLFLISKKCFLVAVISAKALWASSNMHPNSFLYNSSKRGHFRNIYVQLFVILRNIRYFCRESVHYCRIASLWWLKYNEKNCWNIFWNSWWIH